MGKPLDDFGFVTPEQVAEALDVTARTVRNWIKSGRLRATRPGGSRYLVARGDLNALLRDNLTLPIPQSRPVAEAAPVFVPPVAVQPYPVQNPLSNRKSKLRGSK